MVVDERYTNPKITSIKVGEAITYPASKYHYEHYVLEKKVADKIVYKTNGYFNTGVPMETKLNFKVTEEHIKSGVPGSQCGCPISLALKETYGKLRPEIDTILATVDTHDVFIEFDNRIYKSKYNDREDFIFSDTISNWIQKYDNKGTGEPFEIVSVESKDYDNSYLIDKEEYVKCKNEGVAFSFTILEGDLPN